MNERIYDRIRETLETTPGLTQKGLAERMGLNPAAINRMLYGRRNIMAEEIPLIEDYLGVRLELSPAQPAPSRRSLPDIPAAGLSDDGSATQTVPVYHYAPADAHQGPQLSRHDIVDRVTRHPAQRGIGNAFAVYAATDAMAPRYFRGELLYLHPGRPPEPSRDCMIELKNGDTHIWRCLGQSEEKLHVAQFNPPQEKYIPREDIKSIYAVVGRG